ncbi:hypothetical protein DFH11DRAFT_1547594 [Phellopilus nigrolimitatus]|nr:hypothetical protein DFH11DRAFT_1547594 [Phellopilus nigrolimitatus]
MSGPIPNPRLVFSAVPNGLPVPGETTTYDTSQTIDLDTVDLNGGFLVRLLAVSLDPYMRNRMRPADVEGDMVAFDLGGTVTGFGVGEVLRSESATVKAGEHVYGFMPYQHYVVFPNMDSSVGGLQALMLSVVTNEHKLPWRYFVGALGMTGQTAYYGLKDISNPKPGETIYISAASGAVGTILIQLAKSLGLKVIASAGSDAKVALAQSLGADHAFNWRTADTRAELKAHGPLDIFFDNVGGATLEAAIENAAQRARFVICGAVSVYNDDISNAYGVRNLWLVNRYRIKLGTDPDLLLYDRMEGFIVIDWHEKYLSEFYATMPGKLARGEIRYVEHVYHGLDAASQGLVDVLTGKTVGKAVVVIADD